MNWKAVELHHAALSTIVDAAIPNKTQNVAVKAQINDAVNVLINRIADGWLEDMGLQETKVQEQAPAESTLSTAASLAAA